MTDSKTTANIPDVDPQVSDAYRTSATETVPLRLDQAVLASARRVSRGAWQAAWLRGWITPTVFVATAVLSLAVVHNYRQAGSLPTPLTQTDGTKAAIGTPAQNAADGLATAVESTGMRIRELDDAAVSIIPGNKPVSAASEENRVFRSQLTDPLKVSRFCADEGASSPETWWACIEALERDGKSDDARSELELLLATFPDFEPPR